MRSSMGTLCSSTHFFCKTKTTLKNKSLFFFFFLVQERRVDKNYKASEQAPKSGGPFLSSPTL